MLRDSAVFKRTALQFVAVGVVVFALHACGGGGGGGGSNAQLSPRSRQATQAATQATSPVQRGLRTILQVNRYLGGRSHKPRSGKITRQGGCPEEDVFIDGEGNRVVTVDYGAGCTDEDGVFIKGSYTITVSDPEFDENDNLTSGSFTFSYNNYSENNEPPTLVPLFGTSIISSTTTRGTSSILLAPSALTTQ